MSEDIASTISIIISNLASVNFSSQNFLSKNPWFSTTITPTIVNIIPVWNALNPNTSFTNRPKTDWLVTMAKAKNDQVKYSGRIFLSWAARTNGASGLKFIGLWASRLWCVSGRKKNAATAFVVASAPAIQNGNECDTLLNAPPMRGPKMNPMPNAAPISPIFADRSFSSFARSTI